ncbi:cytochrome ubiquinol oxidase subunit I [Paenibacillus aquistagni]|uniref:Cytochrome bd-I ubiquinol oxidase subunit 1 apoprotein n=1 Tax=Paenibacillus aquistagni TaxID=1852522 RepID=A0A1X7LJK5_9BACL|nr:cytochrome ubiquinol oxidase subunit I [Paenibacillus aquistagni]SMG54066.1 cytochrome bd-I ubiquinol oxidase subunit 1 apoprotein [Paenibacillus aquistagni]
MFTYDPVLFSRMLTGLTLIVHIVYATIGVGVPVMIALAEWIGIKRNDPYYLLMARRWARGFTVTVAVGVVTGTAIGLQLNLLWPNFMRVAGQAIALPLFMETFAFFIEAIFLGIYLYTWDRFKNRYLHFWLLIPVAAGSCASAFFITTVNAFMNAPQGFDLIDGKMENIDPIFAMFNPAMPTKVGHVLVTAYVTVSFCLGAIAALAMLRGRRHVYFKKCLRLTMVCALVFSLASTLIGDLSGKYLHAYQPEKLAAAEWHFETTDKAPLIIGGMLTDDHDVRFAIKIPFALSILAGGTPGTVVMGLDDVPQDHYPPLRTTHYLFDLMVFLGMYLLLVAVWYFIADIRNRKQGVPIHKILLMGVVLGAPFSVMAIESGWIFSEIGRQPWILWGVMRTAEGATTSPHVDTMLWLFAVLYLVLTITSARILIRMFKLNPVEEEIASLGLEGGPAS